MRENYCVSSNYVAYLPDSCSFPLNTSAFPEACLSAHWASYTGILIVIIVSRLFHEMVLHERCQWPHDETTRPHCQRLLGQPGGPASPRLF